MNTPQSTDTFYMDLTTFLLAAKQQVVAVSGSFGLSAMQALTLLSLRPDQPKAMKTFAEHFVCDASNVTGIIDGLEQKDLVSRMPHPEDRRIKMIQLTDAGTAVLQELVVELSNQQNSLLVGLTETEIAQLAAILRKISRACHN